MQRGSPVETLNNHLSVFLQPTKREKRRMRMTWKNSRHGPCEFTQSDRLSLLVLVGVCRQTHVPSEG